MPEDNGSPRVQRAIRELQETLLLTTEIERRQTALLRDHTERIQSIESNLVASSELQKHGDERLNALIAVVDGMIRRPPMQT